MKIKKGIYICSKILRNRTFIDYNQLDAMAELHRLNMNTFAGLVHSLMTLFWHPSVAAAVAAYNVLQIGVIVEFSLQHQHRRINKAEPVHAVGQVVEAF